MKTIFLVLLALGCLNTTICAAETKKSSFESLIQDRKMIRLIYEKSQSVIQSLGPRLDAEGGSIVFNESDLPLELTSLGFSDGIVTSSFITYYIKKDVSLNVDLISRKVTIVETTTLYHEKTVQDLELEKIKELLKDVIKNGGNSQSKK